jgi:peptidoglycan/LPS O-acetylase OafA/YrhL
MPTTEPKSSAQQSEKPDERLTYLDGVRGIAAAIILLSHSLSAWLPALAFGATDRRVPYLVPFAHTPLAIFWSGDMAVMVFFVISGFLLARGSVAKQAFGTQIVKRILRLGIPVTAAVLSTGVAFHFGVMRNHQAALVSKSEWLDRFYRPGPKPGLLWSALGGSLVSGSDWWMGPLWSMHVQLFGSLLVLAIVALIGRERMAPLAMISVIVWSLLAGSSRFGLHFAAIVSGALMFQVKSFQPKAKVHKAATFASVLTIVYLGSWPDEETVGPWYEPVANLFTFTDNYLRPRSIAHTIAAVLLVWLVFNTTSLQTILQTKILRTLGRYSFSVYLTHWPLLMSVGALTFQRITSRTESLYLGAIAATAVTMSCTAVAAFGFRRLVDRPSQHLSNVVAGLWEKGNADQQPPLQALTLRFGAFAGSDSQKSIDRQNMKSG